MNSDLSGRTAIVTGASRGIGRAIAVRLAARGAAVAIGYLRNREKAEAVVAEIAEQGGRAIAVPGDLADPAAVRHLFDRAEDEFGTLDIVVANAADVVIKPVIDCTEEEFDRLFAANAKSAFFTMQEAARRLRDGGRIIATSTGGTRMFFTETSLYLGTKAAVEQFVRVLSRELGPRGITVNALSPGFTDTDLLPERDREVAAQMSPFGRVGLPEDVADVAVFLAGDESRWITGQNLGAGGGVF
ncbi:SDR family oxidoreductase [Nocardia blacklockiae]|uniref:SDR family oxidoreductase n=1 Tax=Nocardia blacklockiae TaxID=480036 RepID=UPI0018931F07|nr:SDR family oxidoreductase [Nocardia blacklockiae]MBF6171950.1 SDR family oxidoreductase [Nocardia blacklockiae]